MGRWIIGLLPFLDVASEAGGAEDEEKVTAELHESSHRSADATAATESSTTQNSRPEGRLSWGMRHVPQAALCAEKWLYFAGCDRRTGLRPARARYLVSARKAPWALFLAEIQVDLVARAHAAVVVTGVRVV
ncbi:MAG: hypothetical protein AAF690_19445, partial [Acidobacteriota bacterium]